MKEIIQDTHQNWKLFAICESYWMVLVEAFLQKINPFVGFKDHFNVAPGAVGLKIAIVMQNVLVYIEN